MAAAENGVPAAEDGVPPAGDGVPAAEDGVPAAEDGVPAAEDGVPAAEDGVPAAEDGVPAPVDAAAETAGQEADPERVAQARVDARLLEAALLNLRKRIAGIPLVLDIEGTQEVSAERVKLLSQIDDYLLPRVRQSAAPILVALVGSTGAGKSTLVNSIVGTQVSLTGVRRPTTNSPVLACHPDDIQWFAENVFLPTLPRVRQEGLARPGQDGLLVLAASEGMTRGVALLDTPDIDSVVRAHHEFAYQFLDASDLWLFMTSATRYADAPVWEILQHARERGAALGVVLSRVPADYRAELVEHFNAMLDANGIKAAERFVIPETGMVNGMLPAEACQPVKDWLADTAQRADRRVAVLTQTMAGVLDTFKTRVPKLAAHVDAQAVIKTWLRRHAEAAYADALHEFQTGAKGARLLGGEVLARWQDYAASGDLDSALRGKRPAGKGKRARKGTGATRSAALDAALRQALATLVVSVADKAAERVVRSWRAERAGAALIAAAEASRVEGERADQVFESAFGDGADDEQAQRQAGFERSAPDLLARAARAISTWQDQMTRLVQAGTTGRPALGAEALSLAVLTAMLGDGSESSDDIVTIPRELVTSAFGAVGARDLSERAFADLAERVRLLLDEEFLRFVAVLDAAGAIDPVAAVRLYQAEYTLEGAR